MLSGHYPRGRWPLFFSILFVWNMNFTQKEIKKDVKPRNIMLWVRQDNAR